MDAYDELLERLKNIDLISQIGSLLGWDQEVLMPPKAAALRAEQLAWMSKTGHESTTNPRIGELLTELEGHDNLNDVQVANIRLARDSYDKATKLPTEFVEEMAKHKSITRDLLFGASETMIMNAQAQVGCPSKWGWHKGGSR